MGLLFDQKALYFESDNKCQERVIEDETRKVLNSKQFSKTPEAMDNIRKGVEGEAERQDLEKKLKKKN